MKKNIPVSKPVLGDSEINNVNNALKQGAISGFYGEYISLFEKDFANYSDCEFGVSTTSGTTAIHLALLALSIGKDDEVLVSALTNMATFFAVIYQNARPVPVDIESDTWNLDPALLEAKISPRTRAILVVHLFGHPVDMDPVLSVARKYKLALIEDCAEAHGATYKGKKVGSLGDIGAFSFYANKIITTGEGGMITTNNSEAASRARWLKSLAFGDSNKFMHKDVGYNYRMTNIQAAIGCAQMEKIENIIESKRRIAGYYNEKLSTLECLQLPVEKTYARNVYWMYHIVLKGKMAKHRTLIMKELLERGIETREGFIPYNMQDIFIKRGWTYIDECPRASEIAMSSFYLPSGPLLTEEELEYVAVNLRSVVESMQ
jgi:perosamine synthetase